jgi:hypothetical protein
MVKKNKIIRGSLGTVCIFTCENEDIILRGKRYHEAFVSLGWSKMIIVNLDKLPKPSFIRKVDCILIDVDVEIRVDKREFSSPLMPNNTIQKESYDVLDLLHYYRGHGFKGLICLMHPKGTVLDVKSIPTDVTDSRKYLVLNSFMYGTKIDHHACMPLRKDDFKHITKLAEERLINGMLNMIYTGVAKG